MPKTLPDNWTVTVDGKTLAYDSEEGEYYAVSSGVDVRVYYDYVSEDNFALALSVGGRSQVPGDYTVKIVEAAQESGGVFVVNLTSSGTQPPAGLIFEGTADKTNEEIYQAYQAGKVIALYRESSRMSYANFSAYETAGWDGHYDWRANDVQLTGGGGLQWIEIFSEAVGDDSYTDMVYARVSSFVLTPAT